MEEHVAASARAAGLTYRTEGRDHGNTFDIHRLLHLAAARGRQEELLDLAYRANFGEERSVFDAEVLVALAVEAGLEEAEARAVLADDSAYAAEVRADEREAAELGAKRRAVLRPGPPLRHLRRPARRGVHPGSGAGVGRP